MSDPTRTRGEWRAQLPEYVLCSCALASPKQYSQRAIASFADSQLTDAIKMLASDGSTDPKVKKKLVAVLTAWYTQFKDDPSMTLVANLYKSCGLGHTGGHRPTRSSVQYDAEELRRLEEREREKEKEREEREAERRRKEDEKRKAKEEKEKRKREEEGKRKAARSGKVQRKPFDFEQVRPRVS